MLLHGLVGSSNYWGAAYDPLAESHRLVVPDLLGFGRSPRPEHGYTPDDHVRALVSCLDDLDFHEPAVIAGHSLGVLIAVHLAATHPERVSGIVGFGPPLYPDRGAALQHVGATSPMGRLFVLPGRTAEVACRWVCEHRKLAARLATLTHPSLPRPIAADSVQHTWASYSQTLENVILSTAANASLHRAECTMRFVAGDRDRVVDLPYLRRLRSPSAQVELEEWRGGHDLPLSHAPACAEMIRRVADQHGIAR